MKDHKGCKRQFIHTAEAWYHKTSLPFKEYVDEVVIGMYHKDGGTSGEFTVMWEMLGNELTPSLHAFNDSWSALQKFKDLLKKMAEHDDEHLSPLAFCDLLRSCGIEDATPRTQDND